MPGISPGWRPRLGKARHDALGQMPDMEPYLEDGRIAINNNEIDALLPTNWAAADREGRLKSAVFNVAAVTNHSIHTADARVLAIHCAGGAFILHPASP